MLKMFFGFGLNESTRTDLHKDCGCFSSERRVSDADYSSRFGYDWRRMICASRMRGDTPHSSRGDISKGDIFYSARRDSW